MIDDPTSGFHQPLSLETEGYRVLCLANGQHSVDVPRGWTLLDIHLGTSEGKVVFHGLDVAADASVARSFNLIPAGRAYTMDLTRAGGTILFLFRVEALRILPARHAIGDVKAPLWDQIDSAMISVGEIVFDFLRMARHQPNPPETKFIRDLISVRLLQVLEVRIRDEPSVQQPIQRAIEFIENGLSQDLRGEDIASAAGLSSYHFSRYFRRTMGVSVRRYIILRRIERAREMILNTEKSLAEIAFATGFSSQSHMSTAFRRFTGRTPRSYRSASRSASS